VADISIILPVRDQEDTVASLVRCAASVEEHVELRAKRSPLSIELLAVDEGSGDNTLAVLSVLHGQIANLRTLQDVEPGRSIRRASAVARGTVWLILDHPIDPALAGWAASQVLSGQRAAWVPGELLAVDRSAGTDVLRKLSGGLVSAQHAVVRYLRGRGETAAFSPASNATPGRKVQLLLRSSLGRLGLGRFDKP
jgi:glycosyltransferase involved in cell wall biosynthesis